jgi:ankyrin repeat protein
MISRSFRSKILLAICLLATSSLAQNSRIPDWIQQEKFLRACERADLEAMKLYLKSGMSPNTRDKFGQPALIRAVMGFDVFRKTRDAVRLLLDAGADINGTNEFGSTALFWTVRYPDSPENPQSLLIKLGADVNHRDKYGSTYLERKYFDDHAEDTDEHAWRFLIEGNVNWSAPWEAIRKMRRHSNSATSLMAAAYCGIRFGKLGDRNNQDWQIEVDNNKENFLFYYANRDDLSVDELASLSLTAINRPNSNGESAVMRATRFDNGWLVKKLLTSGAEANRRDNDAKTALDYAVEYDYFDTTLLLLAATDLKWANKKGRTSLMIAAENGSLNALRAFSVAIQMARMAPVEARKKTGKERAEMLELAAKFRKINVNQQDDDGMTALMLAAEAGQVEAVKTLLFFKANKLVKNKQGKTALDLARSKNNTEIVKLLSYRR